MSYQQPPSQPQWQQPPQWQGEPPQQPQWQGQPPQQPYPSQPAYQPQQPPKKSRKGLWIALGIIAAVLIFGCVGVYALINAGANATQHALNQAATAIATTVATRPPQQSTSNKVGQPVTLDGWTVTVNKVSTSQGSEFDTPKAGQIYLVVNVTLKNGTGQNQSTSSIAMFALKDASGQTEQQDIAYGSSPDGTVAAGSVIRGDIAYSVPTTVHSFTLQFIPSLSSSDLAEWTVTD